MTDRDAVAGPGEGGEEDEPRLVSEVAARPRARRPWSAWTQWAISFVGFLLPILAWTLATPEFASPDEVSHVYRAVSAVRGEILPAEDAALGGGAGSVEVPEGIAASAESIGCFAFNGEATADCAQGIEPTDDLVDKPSGAARYNPFYYLLVGWPSLMSTGDVGFFGIRVVSGLLAAGFLASAFVSAWRGRGSRLWRVAVLVATTPMVFFIAAVCNPNGLEIAAAISVWAALLRLVTGSGWSASETGPLLRRFGIAAAALVLTRGLSPLWLAIIGLTCLALADLPLVVRLLRRVRTWLWIGLALIATAGSVGWTLAAGTSNIPDLYTEADKTFLGAITYEWGFMGRRLQEFFGLFGWTDTPSPPLAIMLFAFALGALVMLGLTLGTGRATVVLLALCTAVIVLPLVLEAMQFNDLGLFWQSRYTLPLAVGIPLVAAYAATNRQPRHAPQTSSVTDGRRFAIVLAVAVVVAHAMAFSAAVIRYSTGVDKTLNPFAGSWHPLGGALLVHLILVAGLLVLLWLAGWAGHGHPEPADDHATRAPDSELPDGTTAPPADERDRMARVTP